MNTPDFFLHDTNTRNDYRILELRTDHGWEGYGLYWAVCEHLRNQEDYKFPLKKVKVLGFDLQYRRMKAFINRCIKKYGLFASDGDYFWSESLNRQMMQKDAVIRRNRENGKKGGRPKKQLLMEKTVQKDLNGINDCSGEDHEKPPDGKQVLEKTQLAGASINDPCGRQRYEGDEPSDHPQSVDARINDFGSCEKRSGDQARPEDSKNTLGRYIKPSSDDTQLTGASLNNSGSKPRYEGEQPSDYPQLTGASINDSGSSMNRYEGGQSSDHPQSAGARLNDSGLFKKMYEGDAPSDHPQLAGARINDSGAGSLEIVDNPVDSLWIDNKNPVETQGKPRENPKITPKKGDGFLFENSSSSYSNINEFNINKSSSNSYINKNCSREAAAVFRAIKNKLATQTEYVLEYADDVILEFIKRFIQYNLEVSFIDYVIEIMHLREINDPIRNTSGFFLKAVTQFDNLITEWRDKEKRKFVIDRAPPPDYCPDCGFDTRHFSDNRVCCPNCDYIWEYKRETDCWVKEKEKIISQKELGGIVEGWKNTHKHA